ncbi:MAG: amino acid ABC transporter substrate-binding protein [Synechococcaceae cyanobacterium ELA263]
MSFLRRLKTVAPLALLLTAFGCANDSGGAGVSSVHLAAIRSRGQLSCGVDGQVAGFSSVAADGRYQGFDVDVCRAVAAAVLGSADKVDFRNVTATQRFPAVASGEIDLLSRNSTVTLGRDAPGGNGMSFAPVVFHDGVGVMVPVASGISELAGVAGKPICLLSGATTEQALSDALRQINLAYVPLKFSTIDEMFGAYQQGRCAAVSIDRSALAAQRTTFADPATHRILPAVLSKEPLAPATVQSDPAWADAVRWIVYALFEAEEQGITQANVKARLAEAKANPKLADRRRFLGVEGNLGSELGLPDDFVVKLIAAVGNYGEIYARNVGEGSPLKIPRGPNRLFRDGGLLISPPFR